MGFKDYKDYKTGSPEEEFEKGLSALSEGTAEIYRGYFKEFLAWGGSTPEEFYQWVKGLEASEDTRDRKQITNAYNDFAKTKVTAGKSPNTVLSYRKAIHKFLEVNELTVRIKKNEGKTSYRGKKIIKLDQVRKLADLATMNLRIRALLMTLKDTGLGVSEIAMLTCEDFLGAREYKDDEGGRFKAWAQPLIREKTDEGCHVHMGPDAMSAIEDYLGHRRRGHIFITSKGQPHKDEDGNITSEAGFTEKGSPMKGLAITSTIRNHCSVLRNKGYNVSAHSFRKLFETSFDLEGSLNVAKKIMGKAIPATDEPYLQYEDELTKVYMEVYRKRLSLYRESTQIKELEAEIEELKANKVTEVDDLRHQIDEIQKSLEAINRRDQRYIDKEKEIDRLREPSKLNEGRESGSRGL